MEGIEYLLDKHLSNSWGLPLALILCCLTSCDKQISNSQEDRLFSNVAPEASGINFKNTIMDSEEFNYYKYIYAYNGGGVAAADFNNDGLQDLFFTSNLNGNKLYLNKGGFEFEDITEKTGIKKIKGFDSGVMVFDVNDDGYQDIYVCRAGWFEEDNMYANLLYINNGNLTFTEKAKEYGLADTGRSAMATTFDYDRDGDLDVLIVNAPNVTKDYRKLLDLDSIRKSPETIALRGSDKLYRNDGNHFTDVSSQAGLFPERAFGLHAQVGDLNNDGWLDIYVSNDFEMPDFVYINNGDGTFSDQKDSMLKHMSFYSMGSDMGDINNDGYCDVIVLDMNPEDYVRSKTTMAMTSVSKFREMVSQGYQHQYMHNTLQLNNGNGTFGEIAQMAGLANTDWSWAPLLADFDLDGYQDLYVTNGVFRDVIDQDVNKEILSAIRTKGKRPTQADYLLYTQMLPQQKMVNYFFKNNQDLTFTNNTEKWAQETPSFSNGAVYADLDNDGDLDIVVNNINEPASLLRNNAVEQERGNYLTFGFLGADKNKSGIGTTIILYNQDNLVQTRQLINAKGYLSSVGNTLHFGLGHKNGTINRIEVFWPDGKFQELKDVAPNQHLVIRYEDAIAKTAIKKTAKTNHLFQRVSFNRKHKDTVFDDFQIQLLLPHKLSQLGPGVAKSDINKDGLDDIYLGGAYLEPGQLLLGSAKGGFEEMAVPDLELDREYEDTGAAFFDANGDGHQDLYVVSGSYEFYEGSPSLQDRLYLNNGVGQFKRCRDCLPKMYTAGSVVSPTDFDGDGDVDLFVGGRLIPGRYPYAPESYLLENQEGKFQKVTPAMAPKLQNIGMVTSAQWNDIDEDGDMDLLLTGEWMGIELFKSENGRLSRSETALSNAKGWWNALQIIDIDYDGDKDIVAGNLGLNYKYHASMDKPFHIYTKDFDQNGTEDIILAKYYNEKQVPIRGKSCTAQQIPSLQRNIKSYKEFANKDLKGIFGESVAVALHYEVNEFRSGIFINNGKEDFKFEPFPNEVQRSPINSLLYSDFDGDGNKDLLVAGNNYQSEIETTRADSGIGSLLLGDGKGDFTFMPNTETGLYADKDIRHMKVIHTADGTKVLVVNNNAEHELFVATNPR